MSARRKLQRSWLRDDDESHVVSDRTAVEYDSRRDIIRAQQFRIRNFNKDIVHHAGNDQSADDNPANLNPDHNSLHERQYPRQH
jgi:hypothetical protein